MHNWQKKRSTIAALGFLGAVLSGGHASADFVINDDLIVIGSACVGFDCVNGEVFGFDTLKLKENNLRIKFEDTSSTASFPTNDWQILVNDSANGGMARFSIEDVSGGRIPFTIEAGAPANSLYVDDAGRLGIGTSSPVVELNIKDGNTPTVRLEQDGSSGFAPQTWDVAGNEANFFIRDATNGSTLPFRIRPSAPTGAIDIAGDGDVGFGTAAPHAPVHILVAGTSAVQSAADDLIIQDTGPARIAMVNTGAAETTWTLNSNNSFRISGGVDAAEFQLDSNGNLTITGTITTNGSCSVGCDIVFNPDYNLPSISEHANLMWKNKHLPSVGPTPENGPMNLSQKIGGILNELEKAHIYIDQLHSRIEKLEKQAAAD